MSPSPDWEPLPSSHSAGQRAWKWYRLPGLFLAASSPLVSLDSLFGLISILGCRMSVEHSVHGTP